MKKFILLFLGLAVIACAGNDEDDIDDASDNRNFLEKYDGFGYGANYDDGDEYFYFSDSSNFLRYVEVGTFETVCVEYSQGQMAEFDMTVNVSIATHNSSRLVVNVDYTEDGENYTDSLEFTVSSDGNTLSVMYDNDPTDVDTFTKTTTTFASLCN